MARTDVLSSLPSSSVQEKRPSVIPAQAGIQPERSQARHNSGFLKFTNEVQHYDKVLCLWEKPI
ncbi:MAG: hypothetical protein K2Q12_00695, partial [Rickettsiales bacterium]|nr:hypothetical protein [Rickettsiales bacterium]